MEYKNFAAHVKGYDDTELWIDHFVSVEVEDRGGDTLHADGLRIFGRPTTLFAHGKDPVIGQEAIARPLWIKPSIFKGYKGIAARTKFYDGSHLTPPDNTGRRLYEKARDAYLPNWSVGFIPIKWTETNGGRGRDITEWELLEYSMVPVGMNALAQTPEYKSLAFKFVEDNHKCDCGKNLCQKGDGTFFECRLGSTKKTPRKVIVDDSLIIRLTKEAVHKEFDRLREKVS